VTQLLFDERSCSLQGVYHDGLFGHVVVPGVEEFDDLVSQQDVRRSFFLSTCRRSRDNLMFDVQDSNCFF